MRRGVRLRYLNRSGEWPSGRPRLYFRRKGGKNVPMPDADMDSPAFLAAYTDALKAVQVATHGQGTIGRAVTDYMRSSAYQGRAAGTRAYLRRHLDAIRRAYGMAPLKGLRPKHIRADLAKLEPHPANHRLRAWRALCRWAFRVGRIDANPAREVEKAEAPASDGHEAWTADEVAAFRSHWPVGTAQRLALELLHRSCASIGDACRLSRGMIQDGWLIYERGKSGTLAVVPWSDPPEFFGTDDLDACLAGHAHLTFMVTAQGHPRSPKAAAQWFSRACREAGVNKTAHGLRKYRAAYMLERGATEDQRMAILGHKSRGEASRYARSADAKRVISGTKVPTRSVQQVPTRDKRP